MTLSMHVVLTISILLTFYQLISCNNFITNPSLFKRSKRYLVYPPPGAFAPTKVQLILGLGIPMEVDVSMIMGYVMKFNYVLPYNASYLTDQYVRYDRSINYHVEPDKYHDSTINNGGGRVPLMTRWELYNIVELALGQSRSGKACLLKTICEAAAVPFNKDDGLSSQLIHLFLTPSTSSEPYRTEFDRVYHIAEIMGKQRARSCERLFPECLETFLEYFSEIHD